MKLFLIGGLLLGSGVAGNVPPATLAGSAPATFQIELTRLAKGWSAKCAAGCDWTELSLSCPSACPAILSSHGLTKVKEPQAANPRFSFRLDPVENGWKASHAVGTLWKELTGGCSMLPCVSQVTESGTEDR